MKLGDEQFAQARQWEAAGRLALVGIGVEPGLSDVFARYAADHLFSEIDELGTRDGANLAVDGYDFAPSFSIWTTIEECLNPPVIWEAEPRLVHDRAVQRARGLRLPGRDRAGRVRARGARGGPAHAPLGEARRVTFKYGLGSEFIGVLRTLHTLGLDRTDPVTVHTGGPARCAPGRRGRVPARPGPARRPDARHDLRRPAGDGHGQDGQPREVYLHHLVDNAWSMREYGSQCVVWQTAVNPVVALELLAAEPGRAPACSGRRPSTPVPFLDRLGSYGPSWQLQERAPAGA